MKKTNILRVAPKFLAISAISILAMGCANNSNSAENAKTAVITEESPELEKVGYSIGYMMAEGNKEVVDDLDLDTFESGFRDAYQGNESALTEAQMQEVLTAYQERKQTEMMEKMQQQAVTNKAAGEEFLKANATKPGVQTTASGLQYKVVKPGTGSAVTAADMVKINYEGRLIDGTVFDSSYDRGEPVVFPVKGMIPGFTEGLELMKEGGEYELYIPADIAYGETGNPGIDPNSTLIFKVELIEVNPTMPELNTAMPEDAHGH